MRKRANGGIVGALARALVLVTAAGGAAMLAAGQAAAQQEERDCRCVDASGEEIENCHCFRVPEVDFARGWAFSMERPRARIGVSVGGDSGRDEDRRGVVLRDVVEGSPADEAGLRPGDVVTRVDGRSVLEPLEDEDERELDPAGSVAVQRFVVLVGRLEPDEEVPLEYVRDGETRRTTVVPERSRGFFGAVTPGGFRFEDASDRDVEVFSPEGFRDRVFSVDPDVHARFFDEGDATGSVWRYGEGDGVTVLGRGLDPCSGSRSGGGLTVIVGSRCVYGLHLQDLGPQLAEYFGVEEGVLVIETAEEASLGIRAGDVIRAIDGRAVTDVADVRRILRSYEDDEPVELTVVRRGETIAVRGTRR